MRRASTADISRKPGTSRSPTATRVGAATSSSASKGSAGPAGAGQAEPVLAGVPGDHGRQAGGPGSGRWRAAANSGWASQAARPAGTPPAWTCRATWSRPARIRGPRARRRAPRRAAPGRGPGPGRPARSAAPPARRTTGRPGPPRRGPGDRAARQVTGVGVRDGGVERPGGAEPAAVVAHHAEPGRQVLGLRVPHAPVQPEPVHEHHGRPVPVTSYTRRAPGRSSTAVPWLCVSITRLSMIVARDPRGPAWPHRGARPPAVTSVRSPNRRGGGYPSSPAEYPANWARRRPVLASRLATCFSTVRGDRNIRSAISRLPRP